MKRKLSFLAAATLVGATFAAAAWAQMGGGPGQPARMYDPKTVETVQGEVVAVNNIPSHMPNVASRLTLTFKTAKETLTVYLGPADYAEAQGLKLAAGDKLEVKGSRVMMGGEPVIIPNYLKKGSQVIKFWDEQGIPPWAHGQGKKI